MRSTAQRRAGGKAPRNAAATAGPGGPLRLRNEELAAAFEEIGELLAIRGDNPFRVRAYQRAAQVLRTQARPVIDLSAEQIDALPGIGPDLAAKVGELSGTGHLRTLEKLRREVPSGLRELLALPALGPVRVRTLFSALKVRGPEDLRAALAAGRLEGLPGFGPKLRARLRDALSEQRAAPRRWLWSLAAQYAEPLRDWLRALPGISMAEVAGSYRRGRETVGDLDLVICGRRGVDLAAALRGYGDVATLTSAGPTRCSAQLRNGMQVDVRLVAPESAGAALYYFTGSREHSVQLRQRAVERGLKLNEYGLYRNRRRIAGRSEQEILSALGLPWIAPELRERRGEIEAAEHGKLPVLIELADLQGDLHAHTDASDGSESLEQMVAGARARRLHYLAITDHSRHIGITRGLDAARLERQLEQIDSLNATLKGFTVLKGAEVDILEDGSLALPDAVLRKLDLVVGSIHSHFDLPEARQTARVLRALERPYMSILAHPTGRLIGARAPYALDFPRVLEAAHSRPCYLELNAQPQRLDMDDVLSRAARDQGVLVSIASDAHASGQLDDLAGGVRQARRGWLRREDVLNARSLAQVRELLARTRRGSQHD